MTDLQYISPEEQAEIDTEHVWAKYGPELQKTLQAALRRSVKVIALPQPPKDKP